MITAEDVNRIIGLHGNGVPIVSLYVRMPAGPSERETLLGRVHSLSADLRQLAKDPSVDRDTRLSLRGDLERIEETFHEPPLQAGTLAVFTCSRRDIYEEVLLPRPARERIVMDETPWVRPMLAVLDEYRRCCVVVVDAAHTYVWELYQDELREVRTLRDPVLRKPDYAYGLREHTVHNRARELEKRHYRRTVTMLTDLMRGQGFDVIAVGGHPYEVPGFVEFLPRELRSKVAGTFTIDPTTMARGDLKDRVGEILERYERDEERRLVEQALATAAAGGLAAVGLDDCLWAGSVAAAGRLLVQEGVTVPGVVCDETGWLGRDGTSCPVCGAPVRRTPDVLDELVQAVVDEGGAIEHVETDTALATDVVAAELRFPLPPRP